MRFINTKNKPGFTIVELLIVIVVIGILAAIVIVAYNGVQERAKNTQTVTAVSAWVKALEMYRVDNGNMPRNTTCLGSGYTTGVPGDESSIYSCRHVTTGVNRQASFYTAMEPYIESEPTPAFTIYRDGSSWYKGAYTITSSTGIWVYYVLSGGETQCADISGVEGQTRYANSASDAIMCRFFLED